MIGKTTDRLPFHIRLALTAALAAMLCLSFSATHSGAHDLLCEDAAEAGHECAITVFSHAPLLPAPTLSTVPLPRSVQAGPDFPADTRSASSPEYLTSPGRDPPA